jgi:hypothetical protein
MKQTIDKEYVICAYTKDTTNKKEFAYIFKTDSLGNYMWGKKCLTGTDTAGKFYSVVEVPRQGYIACGYSGKHAFVVKLGLNGNLVWDKPFFNRTASFYS